MRDLIDRLSQQNAVLRAQVETKRQMVERLQNEIDPMGPQNRCRDFDEDCADVCDKVHCWLHDPTQGWCPYLRGGM